MDDYTKEIIDPGDRASAFAKSMCQESYNNCPALIVVPHDPGNFRGAVGHTWQPHILEMLSKTRVRSDGTIEWEMLEETENDGAGGKPQFFTALEGRMMSDCGWEIITMTKDDLARTGRFAAYMVNELNVRQITEENFNQICSLFRGYAYSLREARLANITGEIAIMKDSITAFCDANDPSQLVFTWGGSCHGLAHRDLLIDPRQITERMVVIGLLEHGYRCNGGTFFTKVIRDMWGNDPRCMNEDARGFLRALCKPSLSYANLIYDLIGWKKDGSITTPIANIAGIAHITGGGVWGKFGELLPHGVAAVLTDMPDPPRVFLEAQAMSQGKPYELTDEAGYGTLHGGCGMLLVCLPMFADDVLKTASRHSIEAKVVGETVRHTKHKLTIKSRFRQKPGKELFSKE